MNNAIKIAVSIFFIMILLIVPNIQATEFQMVRDNIEEQIEENFYDCAIVNILDIWDLLEFLHSLLIGLMNFLINFIRIFSQKFVRLLLSPFIIIYYLIWWILMIIFPH